MLRTYLPNELVRNGSPTGQYAMIMTIKIAGAISHNTVGYCSDGKCYHTSAQEALDHWYEYLHDKEIRKGFDREFSASCGVCGTITGAYVEVHLGGSKRFYSCEHCRSREWIIEQLRKHK